MGVRITLRNAEEVARDLEARAAAFEQPLQPLFEAIGNDWADRFRGNITAGGRPDAFAPLSPTTIELRRRGATLRSASGTARGERFGGDLSTPLIRSGQLRDSIEILAASDNRLEVGTAKPGAELLHFGGATAPNSMIPDRPVPARPFVLLTPDDVDLTVESILDYFFPAEGAAP